MKRKSITSYPEFFFALLGIFAFIGLGYVSISFMRLSSLSITGMNLSTGNLGIFDMIPGFREAVSIPVVARLSFLVLASCILLIVACGNGNKSLIKISSFAFLATSVFFIVYFQFIFSDQFMAGMGKMDNDFNLFKDSKPMIELSAGIGLWLSAIAALACLFADNLFKGKASSTSQDPRIQQPFAEEFGTKQEASPAPKAKGDPFL